MSVIIILLRQFLKIRKYKEISVLSIIDNNIYFSRRLFAIRLTIKLAVWYIFYFIFKC